MVFQGMKRMGINKFCKITGLVILVSLLVQYSACTPELTDDEIPYLPFSTITINLNLPEYQSLRMDGGYHYIDGGVRGIILYRQSANSYIAYERNCSFHPNEACATVDVDISNLFMNDPCCHSSFDFASGQPTGGPAWRPLRKYETLLTGSDLTITDAIVE